MDLRGVGVWLAAAALVTAAIVFGESVHAWRVKVAVAQAVAQATKGAPAEAPSPAPEEGPPDAVINLPTWWSATSRVDVDGTEVTSVCDHRNGVTLYVARRGDHVAVTSERGLQGCH